MKRTGVVLALLLADGLAWACSLAGYSANPPTVDRGFVAGRSPPPPRIVEARMEHRHLTGEYDAGPCGADSCDGVVDSYLVLVLRSADAAVLFRLDHGEVDGFARIDWAERYSIEDGYVVVRADPWGTTPVAFELSAYDADGYASEPVHVEVREDVAVGAGSGCTVARSPVGLWLLALGLLVARRLAHPRR